MDYGVEAVKHVEKKTKRGGGEEWEFQLTSRNKGKMSSTKRKKKRKKRVEFLFPLFEWWEIDVQWENNAHWGNV